MSDLSKLYQQSIIEEAKNPYHFEKKGSDVEQIRANNPICGDRFDLFFDDDKIYFHGFGCTISKASTSLMIRTLEGRSKMEAQKIVDEFLNAINNKGKIENKNLAVFEKTDNFKGRLDCVLLSWQAMKKKLEENED